MRHYIRIDPELGDRKAHYPDGALSAFILTLCFAEMQPRRGYFKQPVLRALLERRARWITWLVDHGDLEPRGNLLYVVGWDEWQEGDWKVKERVERIRLRRESVTPQTVTETVTSTVNTPSERLAVGGKRLAVGGSGRQPNGVETPNYPAKPAVYGIPETSMHIEGPTPIAGILGTLRRQPEPRKESA